jgi:hypothetical protein
MASCVFVCVCVGVCLCSGQCLCVRGVVLGLSNGRNRDVQERYLTFNTTYRIIRQQRGICMSRKFYSLIYIKFTKNAFMRQWNNEIAVLFNEYVVQIEVCLQVC